MTFDNEALKQDLRNKWESLNALPKFSGKLAGPFFGYAPETFATADTRILYIGKAKKGTFHQADASQQAFGCNSGMFWSFAKRLGSKTGTASDPLGNIAWSNLCRIGTIEGNPPQALADEQRDLSVQIIKAEIAFLRPSLIVCVAANSIYDDFLYEALECRRGADFFVGRPEANPMVYSRPRRASHPPVLWMNHPERKSHSYLDFAESEALHLLGRK